MFLGVFTGESDLSIYTFLLVLFLVIIVCFFYWRPRGG